MLGQALSNPEKMITVPTGCGEQNMATTVPNIYLLQYLRATETVTTLESKIIQNIKIGGAKNQGLCVPVQINRACLVSSYYTSVFQLWFFSCFYNHF